MFSCGRMPIPQKSEGIQTSVVTRFAMFRISIHNLCLVFGFQKVPSPCLASQSQKEGSDVLRKLVFVFWTAIVSCCFMFSSIVEEYTFEVCDWKIFSRGIYKLQWHETRMNEQVRCALDVSFRLTMNRILFVILLHSSWSDVYTRRFWDPWKKKK